MPRAITAELLTSITATSGTLAVLCKVTRTDSVVIAFASHDKNLTFESVEYKAAPGMDITGVVSSLGTSVDNLELSATFISGIITESNVLGGVFDNASFELFVVNWEHLEYGRLILPTGRLGEFKIEHQGFTVELRSLMTLLRANVGRSFDKTCDADFGDTRCAKDVNGTTVGGVNITATGLVVATVVNSLTFTVGSMSAYPTGHFDDGLVIWTGGNNNGLRMEIKTYTLSGSTGTFTLLTAMRSTVQVGDAFTGRAGCNKLDSTCIGKFANIANFRGFPHIPLGLEQLNTIGGGQATGGGDAGEGGGGSTGGDPLGRTA